MAKSIAAAIAHARKHVTGLRRGGTWFVTRPDRVTDLDGKVWVIESDSAAKHAQQLKVNRAIFALHALDKLTQDTRVAAEALAAADPKISLAKLVQEASKVQA